jgi:DNA-binding transcriptional LysR family regulator
MLAAGELDVALVSGAATGAHVLAQHHAPLVWLGLEGMTFAPDERIPLALFEGPCPFRDAALDALNKAGRPFDIVYTSANLTGIQAAVRAGLGVGVRTATALDRGLVALGPAQGLPPLGDATFSLMVGDTASSAASALADAVEAELLRS